MTGIVGRDLELRLGSVERQESPGGKPVDDHTADESRGEWGGQGAQESLRPLPRQPIKI